MPAIPNEQAVSTGRAPRRSISAPHSGAASMRTAAVAAPCRATSAKPIFRFCSMCRAKKLPATPTATFQAKW